MKSLCTAAAVPAMAAVYSAAIMVAFITAMTSHLGL
jgi:hypothetical protein